MQNVKVECSKKETAFHFYIYDLKFYILHSPATPHVSSTTPPSADPANASP